MRPCAACGHANEPDARFCSRCGTPIEQAAAAAQEERKVVTVLFVDLVGFTSRSEQMDPEDVRALLAPYYARLRAEIERHGGTVEKFIGDAVMALFGAPVAHEDDPERAVRAALAIRDWVNDEAHIEVRIGVNTGEALITVGANPSSGEGMAAGDVVNTAARLQAAAPVNGVLVGERTYRATSRVIDYQPAEPVVAKGKEHPLAVWVAGQARSRLGIDVPDAARTPLVGREREIGVLRDLLHRVVDERSPQLVTLVGVPGIGKSRLLFELSRIVDEDPALISWRQGRSLPYGEGVSFWALSETVKAQAGILDTDATDDVDAKLSRTVSDVVPDAADAEWVQRHLRALIGVADDEAGAGAQRDETFAAWRRFFECLADVRPLVLVFEDLHWAGEGLIDFVDHLVDWVTGVPLLIVVSTRPELLTRRPGWGGGKANAVTLSLTALSDDDTARLLATVLDRPLLDAGTQQQLLARAGGNPLYAEQYAQLVAERAGDAELVIPDSVHGIIGARLDALDPAEKRVLLNAAVVGKVFWAAAVAAIGDEDDRALEPLLHNLSRKQFIRRDQRSTIAGQSQFAFLHVLLRDVAYAQIPRATRVDRHLKAAGWIETLGRPDDNAELLGHHYLSAIELARSTNVELGVAATPAREALRVAGDRAMTLYASTQAIACLEAALLLTPDDAPQERAHLQFRIARARWEDGDTDALGALAAAREALADAGDRRGAAEADARLARIWSLRGERDAAERHVMRAYDSLRDDEPSYEKALVLAEMARFRTLSGDSALDLAYESLALTEQLGLDDLRASALVRLGEIRCQIGDIGGVDDVRRGMAIAKARRYMSVLIHSYNNLGYVTEAVLGDVAGALALSQEASSVCTSLGARAALRFSQGNTISCWLEAGEWEALDAECTRFLDDSQRSAPHYHDSYVHGVRAWVRLASDDGPGATADVEASIVRARATKDPQVLYPALATAAYLFALAGDAVTANAQFDELLAYPRASGGQVGSGVMDIARAADILGRADETNGWLVNPASTPWQLAAADLLEHRAVASADRLDTMGAARSAAAARLAAARDLALAGDTAAAAEQARLAAEFFSPRGARLFMRALGPYLADTSSASA